MISSNLVDMLIFINALSIIYNLKSTFFNHIVIFSYIMSLASFFLNEQYVLLRLLLNVINKHIDENEKEYAIIITYIKMSRF